MADHFFIVILNCLIYMATPVRQVLQYHTAKILDDSAPKNYKDTIFSVPLFKIKQTMILLFVCTTFLYTVDHKICPQIYLPLHLVTS